MVEKTTIARPYAQAIFDLAHSKGELRDWSGTLQLAAAVIADPQVQRLISHPRVRKEQIQSLILDVSSGWVGAGGVGFSAEAKNLVKILIENRRLSLLPEIAAQYELYRAAAERTLTAEVVSAFPVSNEQQARIAAALKKRLGREVSLNCTVDEALLGGVIIRAGDLVIDGSITGQLTKLANALTYA